MINHKALGWIELVVLTGLVIVYSWATYQRNFVWKDEFILWSDTAKKSSNKARPHNNLASIHIENNQMEQAIAEAIIALRLRSKYPNPFISIGEAYFQKGLFDNSLIFYQRALRIRPDYPDAYLGIGNAYVKKGEMDLAIEAYKKVVELRPDNITARINLAAAYGSKGLVGKAITLLRYALHIKPDSPDIHYNLGFAYEELAKSLGENVTSYEKEDLMNKAVEHYKEAVRMNPDDIEARERLLKLMSKQPNTH